MPSMLENFRFASAFWIGSIRTLWSLEVALAYTSESMFGQDQNSLAHKVERPLAPPFPSGPCGGTIINLPRDLFPPNGEDNNSFLNLNLNPLSAISALLPPKDKNIKVWLPSQYHSDDYLDEEFPILYCHDGQNVMDDASSWTGSSLRLVGALTRLYERKMLDIDTPPIVVCIPCHEWPSRFFEYGDFMDPVSRGHGEFVAKKLHPYLKSRFRIKEGPEHTSSIGSSMGGQASLLLILRYPDLFGGAACMSPCFLPGTIAAVGANLIANDEISDGTNKSMLIEFMERNGITNAVLGQSRANLRSKRIYMDNGGDADDGTRVPVFDAMDHFTLNDNWWNPGIWWVDTSLQPMIDAMRWVLDQGDLSYTYEKFPGGRHNERAWAQRIHRPLLALYGERSRKWEEESSEQP